MPLAPSSRRPASIHQGYIVSLGIELLREGGIFFHELTQSQVVFFNHLIEVFGVKGHVILLEVSACLISEPEKFCTFISDPDWRPHQVKTFGRKRQPPPMGPASSEHALNEGQLATHLRGDYPDDRSWRTEAQEPYGRDAADGWRPALPNRSRRGGRLCVGDWSPEHVLNSAIAPSWRGAAHAQHDLAELVYVL